MMQRESLPDVLERNKWCQGLSQMTCCFVAGKALAGKYKPFQGAFGPL
jgi:hypothetical protein